MYAEIFDTNDGPEVIKWRSEEIAENDDGAKAMDRYLACVHCVKNLDPVDVPEGKYRAVWVDEDGCDSKEPVWVCADCLKAGDPTGPGYREV